MLLPESMSRIVIVGTKSHLDETIEALYNVKAIHLIDQTVDADEGFTLGTPRPYSPKASEKLLKVRAMEKGLGIDKHTKTRPMPLGEIKSQITSDSVEPAELEVNSALDRRNDLNQRITDLNATKRNLELLADLPVDLEMYSGYQSIFSMVGTVAEDPTASLQGVDAEVYYSSKKKGASVAAVFARVQDKDKVQSALSACGFMEISVPPLTGSASVALEKTNVDLEKLGLELQAVGNELDILLEKHKDFLRAYDEELSFMVEKGELPVRIATSTYTFVIDAWVPTAKVDTVKVGVEGAVPTTFVEVQETRGRALKESEEAPSRFKEVPTKFNNGAFVKEFEYPTKLNSVPKYQEVDPTILIAIFLPMFFGFMVGDVGYAIPFIILGAYGLKVTHNKDWRAIATVLFFGGIWAFIFGFFFFGEALGMHFAGIPEEGSVESTWQTLLCLPGLESAFSWLPGGEGIHKIGSEYVGFLLKLSVYIGIVHLCIGYGLAVYNKAMQFGGKHGFMEKGGWLLSFLGMVFLCYGLATTLIINGIDQPIATDCLIGIGLGVVVLLVGVVINFKAEGVQAIIELPGIAGNILSYCRLAAIGMSKAGMALAFNYIAINMIGVGLGGIAGIIVGLLMFAFLHLMIWTLAILSAGLHGLRLQYVELMARFFEGGGVEFNPLKIKRVKTVYDENISKEA